MPQNCASPKTSPPRRPTSAQSFAFLTRRSDRCENLRDLRKSVHAETEAIRRGRLSAYFLGSLAAALAAGVLDKLLASRFCFSSVVLSNFGVPTRRFVAEFPRTPEGLVVWEIRYLAG